MKQRMVEHFRERWLPILINTKATDRTAQTILDLERDFRDKRRYGIDWSNLRILHTDIGDVGIEALARAFAKTTTPNAVLELRLVKDLIDETAVGLSNALNTNPSWKTFSIEECNFGSTGWKALARALNNNHVWQNMILLNMELEDEGVEALAVALQQNTQWTNFKLKYVEFPSVNGVKALCEALSVNKTWKSFQLEGPPEGTRVPIDEALSHALRRNQCWETFHYLCPFDFDGELVSVANSLEGNTVWRVFDLELLNAKHVEVVAEGLRGQTSWK